jgi:hypothetical protein
MVPCLVITFPSKTFEPSRLFGSFLLLSNSDRESSLLFDKNPIFGEIWWVYYPETFMSLITSSVPFQGCCRYSTFLPTLSESECIHCNPDNECDSRVVIDLFQWPLLGCCLLKVYLAPRSLYSPFASHALLATK